MAEGLSDRFLELAGLDLPKDRARVSVVAVEVTIEIPITPTDKPARELFAVKDRIARLLPTGVILRWSLVSEVHGEPPPKEFVIG